MGMFDSVYIPCPKCGKQAEFQSKAGECGLYKYTLSDVPPVILGDLAGDTETCWNCDTAFRVQVSMVPRVEVVSWGRKDEDDGEE